MTSSSNPMRLRLLGVGLAVAGLALAGPGCSSQLLSHDAGGTGGRGGDGQDGGGDGGPGVGGQGVGGQGGGGDGLGGNRDAGEDAQCSPPGASCAVSGCCQASYESCISQGSARICAHADLPPTYGGACNGPASSTLPGVSLVFPDDRCSYTLAEAAAGITITYQVVVEQDLPLVHPVPADAGRCQRPGASGIIVGFNLGGGGASYCLCDVGLCPSQPLTTAPRAGRYEVQIPWDGRSWGGPSDTNTPKGAAFAPGTYTLSLSANGTRAGTPADGGGPAGDLPYAISATRHITITP